MINLPERDLENAPDDAKPTLEAVKQDFGFIPNLEKILANSPSALKSYVYLWDRVQESHFSPIEQEVIYLTINRLHDCRYCMAHHTALAKMKGANQELIYALREALPLPDPKLEALRAFVSAMVIERGHVNGEMMAHFLEAGYEPVHVLDVIMAIATKVMSNYTNHVAGTVLEPMVEKYRWQPTE